MARHGEWQLTELGCTRSPTATKCDGVEHEATLEWIGAIMSLWMG